MNLKPVILYVILSGFVIVSYQNCGQTGSIGLEETSYSKMNVATGDDQLTDISDVQPPPDQTPAAPAVDDSQGQVSGQPPMSPPQPNPPVQMPTQTPPQQPAQTQPQAPGPQEPADSDEGTISEDNSIEVDDDGKIVSGKIVGCKRLRSWNLDDLEEASSNSLKNVSRNIKISNEDNISVDNMRGILDIVNGKHVDKVKNARFFVRSKSESVNSLDNIRGFSVIQARSLESLRNQRGIVCVDSEKTNEMDNIRGYLNLKGNVKSLKNFRGILYLDGNIEHMENFRGFLIKRDGSDIGVKDNVKVQSGPLAAIVKAIVLAIEK